MLTHDEAELYDRQIRLWGVNAQSKIRQSKVLMLGFNGVASEVAKILVLAGIDELTIVDNQPIQETDLTSNLFCRPGVESNGHENGEATKYRTDAVKDKLRTLNPLVKVQIDNSSILSKKPEEYKGYDLVTLNTFLTIDETSAISDICRNLGIKFYVVLDYGFFGFMFNDLGPSFKFSYEEFSNLSNNSKDKIRESGGEADPISLGDDAQEDEPDDVGYGTSDDEDDRPKKKRRIHSPNREPAEKVDNEKKTKLESFSYVTFQDMISLKSTNFNKQTSPVLLVSVAMYRFYTQYGHLPRHQDSHSKQEDISKLNQIIVSLRDSLNLPDHVFKRLYKEWSEHIYGSMSPVCAVMGGVAGQDMIRALSNKDIPLNNTFAFDGISMNGIVEKVGISVQKSNTAQPIVRDFLQIDDDD